jgi:hypothetical protein
MNAMEAQEKNILSVPNAIFCTSIAYVSYLGLGTLQIQLFFFCTS